MIAALAMTLAERIDDAKRYAATICRLQPGYSIDDFLRAFSIVDQEPRLRAGARRIGLG